MAFLQVTSFTLICLLTVIIIPVALCDYQPFSGRSPPHNIHAWPHCPAKPPVYYTLAIQWGRTVCKVSHQFCHSIPKNFTIHGLWPGYQQYCRQGADTFDPMLLGTIRQKLDSDWIDAKHNDNVTFWSKEYYKHGTCVTCHLGVYFNMSLDAYKTIQSFHLASAVIHEFSPHVTKVKEGTIYSKLKAKLGKDFQMICFEDKQAGNYKLQELRIKVLFSDSNGKWTWKPDNLKKGNSNFGPGRYVSFCPPGADIMLP